MVFVTIYFISGLLFFFGLRAVLGNHGLKIHKKTFPHVALLTLIPFVNTLFALMVWLEFFYGEKE